MFPSRGRTVAVLILTALVLLTLDSRGNAAFDAARRGFGAVTRPFVVAADVAVSPFRKVWAGMTEVDKLRAQNDRLRAQLDASAADLIAAENAIIQANELKEQVNLEQLAGIPRVTGDIIGDSPSNFDQRVELGVGTDRGVRVGMPVVSGGLVGKVTEAYPQSCQVMLVSDPQYAVRVKIVSSPESGTATSVPSTTPSAIPVNSIDSAVAASTTNPSTSTPDTVIPEGTVAPTTATTSPPTTAPTTVPPSTTTGASAPATTVPPSSTTTTTEARFRETGTLRGNGGDRLPSVSFVYSSQQFGQIEIGDDVLTTGGRQSLAPANIPVGRVVNVIEDNGVDGVQVEVELASNLDQLNFLTVLLYQPPSELGGE